MLRSFVIFRRAVFIVDSFELLPELFFALARRLDLGSALGQLRLFLLLLGQGSLLLAFFLLLLEFALANLFLQCLKTRVGRLPLLCKFVFLSTRAVPVVMY